MEKYELTRILKVYGGLTPDHDGTQVSIKVKSPVPMAVAVLPSPIAGQLYLAMMEKKVEHGRDSRAICQQLTPVLHRSVRGDQCAGVLIASHHDLQ
jgi:hypothetical protein